MLIHKIDVQDDYMSPIYEAEQYLIDTCKEYSIDYDTCTPNILPIVTEGVFSAFVNVVKTIFQKVIALLVKIWKAIVGFLKSIVTKAMDYFKKLLGFKVSREHKVKMAVITKPGVLEEKTVNSTQDVVNEYKKANQNFNNEILKLEQQNIGHTKRLEQTVVRDVSKEGFDLTGLLEKVVYNDKTELDDIKNVKRSGLDTRYIEKTYGKTVAGADPDDEANLQGDSHITHHANANMSALDNNMMQQVLEAKDVCAAYNAFKSNSMAKLREYSRQYMENQHSTFTLHFEHCKNIIIFANNLIDEGWSDDEINRYLGCSYFPSFDDITDKAKKESAIRKWLHLRINWNNGIIKVLQKMVSENAHFLGLTTKQAEFLAMSADEGDVSYIKMAIEKKRSSIMKNDGTIINGKPIGLGSICISYRIAEDGRDSDNQNAASHGWYYDIMDLAHNDSAITYMSKYDITIVAHGGWYYSSRDDEIHDHKRWCIEFLPFPDGGNPTKLKIGKYRYYQTDIVEYLEHLIQKGYKRINIVSCNPEHVRLPKEMILNKRVLIRMNNNNGLITM